MCKSNCVHKEGGKVSNREEGSWGRNVTKERCKIRATEKEENKSAHTEKLGRKCNEKRKREAITKKAERKVRHLRQRTRTQTKICLGTLENHWNQEGNASRKEKGVTGKSARFRRK